MPLYGVAEETILSVEAVWKYTCSKQTLILVNPVTLLNALPFNYLTETILCQYLTDKLLFNCLVHFCHITDNMKLVYWSLLGGLFIWYSEKETVQLRTLFVVTNVTAHPSRYSSQITVLLYHDGLLWALNAQHQVIIRPHKLPAIAEFAAGFLSEEKNPPKNLANWIRRGILSAGKIRIFA